MKKTKLNFLIMVLGIIVLASTAFAGDVSITPHTPVSSDNLACNFANDDGTYLYRWYKDGSEQSIYTKTVDSSKTLKGQVWTCKVIDGVFGGEVGQDSVTIESQMSGTVTLEPVAPNSSDNLFCNFPNDDGTYLYRWYKDGSQQSIYTATVDSSKTSDGQNWYCMVIDGIFGGSVTSNQVTIGTSISPGSISIQPLNPTTVDDLTCTSAGDDGTYLYRWYKGSTLLPDNTKTLSNSKTKKGDKFTCKMIDGVFGGEYSSSEITVLNSLPTITQPSIAPTTAYTDTSLTCTKGTTSDADGDSITTSYAWLKNNNIIGTEITSTLSGSNFVKGDSVVCRTTPSDGSAGVSVDSTALVIQNSIPILVDLPDFNMDQASTTTKDYSTYVSDNDGDSLTLTASGNTQITVEITSNSVTYTAPNAWSGTETITFTLSDGTDSVTDDVIVTVDALPNTCPVADFTYSPISPRAGETISFTDTSSDLNGDTLTYNWDFGNSATSIAQNPANSYVIPGTYDVSLTVTDGTCSNSTTKPITVTARLNVDSIACISGTIAEGEIQSCVVRVSAESTTVGGVSVTAKFTDDTEFGTCTTDSITGACTVTKTMDTKGTYTIHATAEKSGYTSDMDSQPQVTFLVWEHAFEIEELKTYDDNTYSNEDSDFFRGESLYVKFQVVDKNDNNILITDSVTQVTLQSPPGGLVNLSIEKNLNDGWYYYSLKPIPATHDFKGDSQVFTFAFRFSDQKMGQKNVTITIRNNLPEIVGTIPDVTVQKGSQTTLDISGYKRDTEDSGSDLTWAAATTDSLFTASITGDMLTVGGIEEGTGTIILSVTDLDGDSVQQTINVEVQTTIITPEINITDVSNLPINGQTPIYEDQPFTYQINVDYTGNSTLSYSLTGPDGMIIDSVTGLITWNPTNDQVGTHTVTVIVTDGTSTSQITFTVTVTNVNDAPVASFDYSPLTPRVHQTITFTDSSTDEDSIHGDTLTYSWDFGDGVTSTEQNPTHEYTTPGTYGARLTVTDSVSASDSITKTITVTGGIVVTSIDCLDNVITGGTQSCSVYVEADGEKLGGADVKLYYSDDTQIDTCTTDSLTGACNIQFTAGTTGAYSVYATAEKSGYEADLDKQPVTTFNVLDHRYTITNLNTYADNGFIGVDSDFLRGENLYVKFQVTDDNNGNAIVNDIVTEVNLVSPPGGIGNLVEFQDLDDGWYYYALEPIPATHDFKGDSQVFTFAFNFTDNSMGQKSITITIRNNPPTVSTIPDVTVTIIATEYTLSLVSYGSDIEDSSSSLTWAVEVNNESIATASIVDGNILSINPKMIGETTIKLIASDLDGDTVETTVNVKITSAPGDTQITHKPVENVKVDRIRMPAKDSVKVGGVADLSFNLNNDGDLDSEDIRITATILGINGARKKIGPFDLDEGKEVTKHLKINIPKNIEKGDYTVKIVITSKDELRRVKYRMLKVQ